MNLELFKNDRFLMEDLECISNVDLPYEDMRGAKIFISGATGLIGVSLIRALLYINFKYSLELSLIALVRNKEKAQEIFKKLDDSNTLVFIDGDVNQEIEFEEEIDYIFHCASVTASKMMVEKPVETILTSVVGTKNVFELARKSNCKSIVYVSSMEMYGSFDKDYDNVTEDKIGFIDPLNLRSNYPESKRLCENMCIAYWTEYGLPIKISRLSQTFGAGVLKSENRVFAQFARSVIENKNIVLHTDGLSEGNYCYISDAVAGLFTILLRGENGKAYNVVNQNNHTNILSMAKMVAEEIAKKRIEVVFDIPSDNRYGYPKNIKLNLNSDALQNLGWTPRVSLKDAFIRMIETLKTQL